MWTKKGRTALLRLTQSAVLEVIFVCGCCTEPGLESLRKILCPGRCTRRGRVQMSVCRKGCNFIEKRFYFLYIVYKDNLPLTVYLCVTVSFIKKKYHRILSSFIPWPQKSFFISFKSLSQIFTSDAETKAKYLEQATLEFVLQPFWGKKSRVHLMPSFAILRGKKSIFSSVVMVQPGECHLAPKDVNITEHLLILSRLIWSLALGPKSLLTAHGKMGNITGTNDTYSSFPFSNSTSDIFILISSSRRKRRK